MRRNRNKEQKPFLIKKKKEIAVDISDRLSDFSGVRGITSGLSVNRNSRRAADFGARRAR